MISSTSLLSRRLLVANVPVSMESTVVVAGSFFLAISLLILERLRLYGREKATSGYPFAGEFSKM